MKVTSPEGSEFQVGTLTTASGNFRTFVLIKQKGSTFLIQEIRFGGTMSQPDRQQLIALIQQALLEDIHDPSGQIPDGVIPLVLPFMKPLRVMRAYWLKKMASWPVWRWRSSSFKWSIPVSLIKC
jgi:hypothetical protein